MTEPEARRSFQQRLLDGVDRSRIREEALRVRSKRFRALKKRYGTILLGASLAVGGIGIPLRAQRMNPTDRVGTPAEAVKTVHGVTSEFASLAGDVTSPLDPAQAERQMTLISEQAKKDFFETQVPFGNIIYKEAKKNDLPPELVAAVVQQESRFKPTAQSHRGAKGLMQLMPRTGRWMGAKNLLNPADNVRAGAKYLKYLHERFDGDETKVIAAYNGGEGNVRKYDGVPPFGETRHYVKNVKEFKKEYEEKVAGRVAATIEQQAPSVAVR